MHLKLSDLALSLLAEIVGLDDLHFGWFEPGEAATLDGLRIAQRRYTEKLLAELPIAAGRLIGRQLHVNRDSARGAASLDAIPESLAELSAVKIERAAVAGAAPPKAPSAPIPASKVKY